MQPTPAKKIRLLIVEDHQTVRARIRALLRMAGEVEVVGEAADGGEAVEMTRQFAPDFMLLDLELPTMRGDAVLRQVLQDLPGLRVLVLSSHNDREYIQSMLAGGARGYCLKEEAPALLLKAIRGVDAGTVWISPRVAETLLPAGSFEQALSWRELAILQRLVEGESQAQVAAALGLSDVQVGEHLALLSKKFEVSSLEALLENVRKMLPKS